MRFNAARRSGITGVLYPHLAMIVIVLVAFALRIYELADIPNGLFTDEAARGYDAFSMVRTGADMFGNPWPLFFRGFDDYTAGLYVYLTTPFVQVLELSRFSTRLASALIGVLTVAVAYQAIRRPFGQMAGLAGAGLLAVSPWYVLLSRIGTEWNTLSLGPMLTIVLAYRGLQRPKWLIAAGLAGGISLYGYAPVRAFLPLLLAGFGLFYWRPLLTHKAAALTGAMVFGLLAIPVYTFSLTASGLTRFKEIGSIFNLSWPAAAGQAVVNYLAYFDPRFLFMTDPTVYPHVFFIQRLKHVGLLYWFELPLVLVGLFCLFRLGRRAHYFWLFWLLLAPVGINLHVHSPKPALWLTATPTLHGLAGAGLVYLAGVAWQQAAGSDRPQPAWKRGLAGVILAGLLILALFNVRRMLTDLFFEFPVYAAHTPDWGYGMERAMPELMRLQPAFDQANVDTFGAVSAIYAAFYGRYPPEQRHAEQAAYGEHAWQRLGALTIGQVEAHSRQPGCHVSLIAANKRPLLPGPQTTLISYPLPDGSDSPLLISAIASPQTESWPVQAVFGEQILLDSAGLASARAGRALVVQPGQALCVVLSWRSTGHLTSDYTVFVHLLGPANPASGSPLWAQHDSAPAGGDRPTSSWQPGEMIQDLHVLLVPSQAPPATYQLKVGLYDPVTGERLAVRQPEFGEADQVTLLELEIRG